jgi:hypothetical protein
MTKNARFLQIFTKKLQKIPFFLPQIDSQLVKSRKVLYALHYLSASKSASASLPALAEHPCFFHQPIHYVFVSLFVIRCYMAIGKSAKTSLCFFLVFLCEYLQI